MKNFTKILLLMLALVSFFARIPALAAPGDKVTGVVKDAKGNPVIGAVVSDEAQKAYTLTDDK